VIVVLVFIGLVVVSGSQAILTSMANRGAHTGWWVFALGIGISWFWVLLAKYSTSLLRDGLIWDIVIAGTFTTTLIVMGHGEQFQLKHWIALVMTLVVILYWAVIKYI
jgi:hypothetical protein